ncbi:MAG: RdgB/HAM1 family non-canonical purine NTP pyrophosphatase [Leptospiraceae bacterium]|nr:RdgB/HAM1 family non-canonical purine NTP pyrophosphatase [Leptospiraceae bacterium]
MIPELLLASGNKKKLQELQSIFADFRLPVQILSPADLSLDPDALQSPDGKRISIEETGTTFQENARIKSLGFFQATGIPCLSDDSGLCVDALGGEPGVYSARYGGSELDDAGRNALLLKNLAALDPPRGRAGDVAEVRPQVPSDLEQQRHRRAAHFVCVLCLVLSGDSEPLFFEGKVDGWIAEAPSGSGGFGYDPIFIEASTKQCFAELSPQEKAALSHRGKAMRNLARYLKENL